MAKSCFWSSVFYSAYKIIKKSFASQCRRWKFTKNLNSFDDYLLPFFHDFFQCFAFVSYWILMKIHRSFQPDALKAFHISFCSISYYQHRKKLFLLEKFQIFFRMFFRVFFTCRVSSQRIWNLLWNGDSYGDFPSNAI